MSGKENEWNKVSQRCARASRGRKRKWKSLLPNAQKGGPQEEWREKDTVGHLLRGCLKRWALYLFPGGTGRSSFKPQQKV